MSETQKCPSCGCDLQPDAPSGLCPECLLTAGLGREEMNDVPSPFAVTTPQPGIFIPPKPESLAALFPQLEILESLGHGGMGAVYKAKQKKLDRHVALKILRPESADDPSFAERFNREARTLARLHHPHIVSIHDYGEVTFSSAGGDSSGKLYYFLMEYVDGASLRQLIHGGDLQPDQSLAIMAQICEAMQFAHDEHVVHRDIKPENILVDSRGRVKIADFGLAKLVTRSLEDFTLTGTHQVMGTPRYMAPEQMEGSHLVDHRADIYSLGVVFYEMLTGQVPAGHFEPPSRKVRVDPRIDQIVLRALAREPHRRYPKVSDLGADIAVVGGSSVIHSYEQIVPIVAEAKGSPEAAYRSEHEFEMLRLDAVAPAGGLILVGMLGTAFWGVLSIALSLDMRMAYGELAGLWGGAIAAMLAGCYLIFCGLRLRKLQSYELCLTASFLAALPWSPAAIIGIPVGIWTLRTLTRPQVKWAFAREHLRKRGVTVGPQPMPAEHQRGAAQRPQYDSQQFYSSSASESKPFPGPSTMIDRGVEAVGRLFK